MAGIYAHIPFCQSKCTYCDFYSHKGTQAMQGRYIEALMREAQFYSGWQAQIHSVYIGGGTPSLLAPEAICAFLNTLKAHYHLSGDAEITMEANPGTLTLESLKGYFAAGVNRLSLGVQSHSEARLALMGRIHVWEDVVSAIRGARQAGFTNISMDLMYGLPGQTIPEAEETLARVLALQPQHISCYALTLHNGTPMAQKAEEGALCLPDEDTELAMEDCLQAGLLDAGFDHYEVSNYAKPGHECRHNILYWENGEYLGLGSAAHGRVGMERTANPSDTDAYISAWSEGKETCIRQALTPEEDAFDTLMMGLRMVQGLDLHQYAQRHQLDVCAQHSAAVEKHLRLGNLLLAQGYLRLTPQGMKLQNRVLVDFL